MATEIPITIATTSLPVVPNPSTPAGIATILYLCIVIILSVTSNGLVCLIFYKKPVLRTVSNTFVLNLSCCGLGISLLVMPFALGTACGQALAFNITWCTIQGYLLTVLMAASNFTLLVISVDRNYAIMNSLRYRNVFTHVRCKLIIIIVWLTAMGLSLPPFFGWGKFALERFTCGIQWFSIMYQHKGYPVVYSVLTFFLPLLIMSWCYLAIFKAAMGHTRRSRKIQPSVRPETSCIDETVTLNSLPVRRASPWAKARRNECKALKTILILSLAYLTCWAPYISTAMIKLNGGAIDAVIETFAICLLFMSCTINPTVYALMNRVTRHEFRKYFFGIIHQNDDRVSTVMDSEDYFSTTQTHSSRLNIFLLPSSSRPRAFPKSIVISPQEMGAIKEESEQDMSKDDSDENAKYNRAQNNAKPISGVAKNTRNDNQKNTNEIIVRIESRHNQQSTSIRVLSPEANGNGNQCVSIDVKVTSPGKMLPLKF